MKKTNKLTKRKQRNCFLSKNVELAGELLGACDVIINGRHLGFNQELEIRLNPLVMVFFFFGARHEKYS